MSSYSTNSNSAPNRSRPQSYAFPHFHSSLPYALVRDFAYPIVHPNHYGPPPEPSGLQSETSTPQSEFQRRLSDAPKATWEGASSPWQAGPWAGDGSVSHQQLPQMAYRDGPPYSEDEDLHSPVVVSSRRKKYKSGFPTPGALPKTGRGRSPGDAEDEGGYFATANGSRSESYQIQAGDEDTHNVSADLRTYHPDQARLSMLAPDKYHAPGQRDSHFAATLPSRRYNEGDEEDDSGEDSEMPTQIDESRFSKDYQFTIASPDEEMHGKAVALFDFARENENELPLVEGQVIWVSYRHGQGWLVAEDPKTGESGLVPEEYVRLLRDIEGGWTSLNEELSEQEHTLSPVSPDLNSAIMPTQPEQSNGNGKKEKRPPIVSTFSTSSKDLNPYPHKFPSGPPPSSVMHYGSQSNTPILTSAPGGLLKRGSSDSRRSRSPEQAKNQRMTTQEESSEDSSDTA